MRGLVPAACAVLGGCDLVYGLPDRVHVVDAAIDVGIDAPEACPDTYNPIAGAPSSSVYRLMIGPPRDWQFAHDDCKNDSDGITHLAVLDDVTELQKLRESVAIDATGNFYAWVGFARDTNADPYKFYAVTGEEVPYPSEMWQQFEPNNGNGKYEEEALWFSLDWDLVDAPWTLGMTHYFCECDGRMETRQFTLLQPP
jgi:hypothetical protein